MKFNKCLVSLVSVVAILCGVFFTPISKFCTTTASAAQATINFSLSCDHIEAYSGDVIEVYIDASNYVGSLSSMHLLFKYDTNVLEPVEKYAGTLYSQIFSSDFDFGNPTQNLLDYEYQNNQMVPGGIQFISAGADSLWMANATTRLVAVKFTIKENVADVSTAINLVNKRCTDIGGNEVIPGLSSFTINLPKDTASENDFDIAFNSYTGNLELTFTTVARDNSYQIWGYTDVGNDTYSWYLISPYGAEKTAGTPVVLGNDTDLLLPTGIYKIMVIAKDASGNVSHFVKTAVTEEEAKIQSPAITKFVIDGKEVLDKAYIDLSKSTPETAVVYVNKADSIQTVYGTNNAPIAFTESDDKLSATFALNITTSGTYTYNVSALHRGYEFTRTLEIVAYSGSGPKASFDKVQATANESQGTFNITTPANAEIWNLTVKGQVLSSNISSPINFDFGSSYGVYSLFAWIGNSGNNYDDAQDLYYNNARPGADWQLKFTQSGPDYFEATCNKPSDVTTVSYQWIREDASGPVVVKDWTSGADANKLNFTMSKDGRYNIICRVKGNGAGSYEAQIFCGAIKGTASTLTAETVSLSTTGDVVSRIPVTLTADIANAALPEGSYQYKFIVADDQLQARPIVQYSPVNTCTWIPRKPGDYTVSVYVRTNNTYGIYEIADTKVITVS